MNSTELYKKTDELVDKFKNGRERYQKSALFNTVVQSLVRGADPYEIIDQLISITDDTSEALKQYMLRASTPIHIPIIK